MKSLPTIEQVNRENLLEVVRTLDPELYMVKIALEETGVSALIMPAIIRTIGNLTIGTGHGVVQIYMQAKIIKNIKTEENVKMDQPALDIPESE